MHSAGGVDTALGTVSWVFSVNVVIDYSTNDKSASCPSCSAFLNSPPLRCHLPFGLQTFSSKL